jgi:hypothetical protein
MDVYGAFRAVKGKEAEINRKKSEFQNLKSTTKTLSALGKELDKASEKETKLKGGMDRMKVTLREHEDFLLETEMETMRA